MMASDIDEKHFRRLFIEDIPLMDVRAPVEFNAGAFPMACNRPLLDDQQRHEIGCIYAEHGEQAAISRGLELATGEVREQRIASWMEFVERHPQGYLYCLRGGLRSRTVQQWLREAGVAYPLVEGGYKALRGFLLHELERLASTQRLIVLAGATACGKTELLRHWPHSVDLEAHARHRGSAFGTAFIPQPTQIDFENAVTIDWLKREDQNSPHLVLEAESRLIGRLNVPLVVQQAMRRAPIVELRCERDERIQRLRKDYIEFSLQHFRDSDLDCWQALFDYISDALQRIRKRLGGKRFAELLELLPDAIADLRERNSWLGFDAMIEQLVDHYYDKMYKHHLQDQQDRIAFRGSQQEVLEWLVRQQA